MNLSSLWVKMRDLVTAKTSVEGFHVAFLRDGVVLTLDTAHDLDDVEWSLHWHGALDRHGVALFVGGCRLNRQRQFTCPAHGCKTKAKREKQNETNPTMLTLIVMAHSILYRALVSKTDV